MTLPDSASSLCTDSSRPEVFGHVNVASTLELSVSPPDVEPAAEIHSDSDKRTLRSGQSGS